MFGSSTIGAQGQVCIDSELRARWSPNEMLNHRGGEARDKIVNTV